MHRAKIEELEVSLKECAKAFYDLGLNVVLWRFFFKDGEWKKQPIVDWKQWIKRRQTEAEFESLPWSSKEAEGFSVILGKMKNGLYFGCIDFDRKKLDDEKVKIQDNVISDFTPTYAESTINKGVHLFYFSKTEPKGDSRFHEACGVEVLPKGKAVLMSGSRGYKILNDVPPTIIPNINEFFEEVMRQVGIEPPKKAEVFLLLLQLPTYQRSDLVSRRC